MTKQIAVLGALLCGCVDGTAETGEVTSGLVSANKLAVNKLAANKLAANKLAANGLDGSALPTLAQTEDGREVLSYILSCALPEGSQIEYVIDATVYSFAGEVGLAPDWSWRAPTITERRWVTACVLSRTNLYGISVQVSMRGSHPALAGSLAESSGFSLREGAFYGDLFDPDGPRMYACELPIQSQELSLSTFDQRACASSLDGVTTLCGMTYTGLCVTKDSRVASACSDRQFPYSGCRAGTSVDAPSWDEVITVSLPNS
jgi:hypothetical protein